MLKRKLKEAEEARGKALVAWLKNKDRCSLDSLLRFEVIKMRTLKKIWSK
jgi:hypothetical protein